MLVPGLLCLRGWSQHGYIFYAVAGGLLLSGSVALFCGLGRGRHYLVSLTVMISGIVLLLMNVFSV